MRQIEQGIITKASGNIISLFLVAQVVFAVVLLTERGLLIRSFVAIQSVDPGFRTSRVIGDAPIQQRASTRSARFIAIPFVPAQFYRGVDVSARHVRRVANGK
jgi:hypothetical protein